MRVRALKFPSQTLGDFNRRGRRSYREILSQSQLERKAGIHGFCIKLYTDSHEVKGDVGRRLLYARHTREHCKLLAVTDPLQPKPPHDPYTKSAFLFDFDYYGWVKSIALGLAGEAELGKPLPQRLASRSKTETNSGAVCPIRFINPLPAPSSRRGLFSVTS